MKIEKGIWFYEGRNKPFRVGIKANGKIKWWSYHETIEQAREALTHALKWRETYNSLKRIEEL